MTSDKICDNCVYYKYRTCTRHAPTITDKYGEGIFPKMQRSDTCGDFLAPVIANDLCNYFNKKTKLRKNLLEMGATMDLVDMVWKKEYIDINQIITGDRYVC